LRTHVACIIEPDGMESVYSLSDANVGAVVEGVAALRLVATGECNPR
jgi:hypothetical protein